MIYALMLFVTLHSGDQMVAPVSYFLNLQACELEKVEETKDLEALKERHDAWTEAHLVCMPIQSAHSQEDA